MDPLIFLDTRSRRRDDGVPAASQSSFAFSYGVPQCAFPLTQEQIREPAIYAFRAAVGATEAHHAASGAQWRNGDRRPRPEMFRQGVVWA